MQYLRAFLIAFFGNYVLSTIVPLVVYFVPGALTTSATGTTNPYYLFFIALSAVAVALLAWWFLKTVPADKALKAGVAFGAIGFLIVVGLSVVSNISTAWIQTGSVGEIGRALASFVTIFTASQTYILLAEWLLPSALTGWWLGRKKNPAPMTMAQ
jgi:hypothetical protein